MRARAVVLVAAVVLLAGCTVSVSPTGDATTASPGSFENRTATVTAVVDGDTVDVRFRDGSTERVRLLGVDTPEVRADNTPAEFEGVPDTDAGERCLRDAGTDASEYATQTLDGETVTVAVDPASDRRGDYGRLLAYVFVDGRNVNYRLVEQGHARVYDAPFSLAERFYRAESDAQAARRGVWACRDPAAGT
ncbi:thermonuclease family protein [Halobacteriaceae archaeon GCM10025711]